MRHPIARNTFYLVFLMGALIFPLSASSGGANTSQSQPEGYPIGSDVQTTLQRTVVPDPPSASTTISPSEVSQYKQNGYGSWHYGSPLDAKKQLDIMPAAYTGASVTHTASLLHFFTISDIHITDKESPSSAIELGLKDGISSGYSPVMLYTTHVLDAAVQTINALHKQHPIDFGISLGDACNNTQYNEIRWYVDVLDGRVITPSSGVHGGADTIDYQKPYKAAGLDKTINWYQALGNHDHFWMGTNPVTDYLRQNYVGTNILELGDIFADPAGGISKRQYYMGTLDGSTPYGDVKSAGLVSTFASPQQIAADPNRRSLSRKEWMNEFFRTSSNPVGHGFTRANVDNDFASYSFQPKSAIPIKVIVLDDTQKDDDINPPFIKGTSSPGYGHGSLDKERYDWLVNQLDDGQADGQLMIIAAHIPIGVEPAHSYVGWNSAAYVSQTDLIAKLHTYPNLILWLAGHRHYNTVTPLVSPDPVNHPELGFWEVETSSLRDFPQQFRTFQIVRNSDNTISIFTTNVDPAVKDGSPAAISRSYAIAAYQLYAKTLSGNPLPLLPTGSYNAELVKELIPGMQAKIKNYGTAILK